MKRARRVPFRAAAAALTLAAAPAFAQVSVSITSTPANGTHYASGEAITTRLTIPQLNSGDVQNARMRLNIGGVERQAASTTGYAFRLTQVNFSYTVVAADLDTDGISIPANSIVGAGTWRTGGLTAINRSHGALGNQSSHRVFGTPFYISARSPATLTEANLNGATVTVSLVGHTFASGVSASSFALVSAVHGLSVSSVTGGASGSTSATLTLAFNSDFHLPSTLGVRVLAAAHSGSTDITTGKTLPLAPTPDILTDPATLSVNEGASATYTVVLAREPSASVTVTVASDNADVTADTSTASGTQTTLTFTTNNWSTAQTVTVAAAGDSGSADETATLTPTASGGGYGGSEYGLFVAIQDDEQSGTDYDADEDGLIDIDSLDKLNAMRWDLDGDGAITGGNATSYEAAFPGAAAGMGCPDGSDADDTPDACTGYELTQDLDFDTDGSGATWAGPVASPVADPNDAYYNGGGGFVPIGNQSARFNATFHGNGHVIANLFSQRSHHDAGFFGATGTSARIVAVGFRNLRVRGWNRVGGVVGHHQGRIAAVWVTGDALGGNTVGGLVGQMAGASSVVVASYSTAAAHTGNSYRAGLIGWIETGAAVRTSYSTGAAGQGFSRGPGTVVASYWDTNLSGIGDDSDNNPPEGRTSAQLRQPRDYTGLYAVWNAQDVDGDGASGESIDDDAWDFGTRTQHPVLKFGGFDAAFSSPSNRQTSAAPSTAPAPAPRCARSAARPRAPARSPSPCRR